MKVLIARLNHETNTFSPVPTPLSSFGLDGPDYGQAAYRANKGAVTPMGAFIDLAETWNAEIVTPVSAMANPSGPVDADAYETLCQTILAEAPGCDALLLDLHGAMVTTGSDDGEGDLLARLRAVCPDTPIVVALDLHGNVTQKMMGHADIVAGFKTYPHIDMYETGHLAASVFHHALTGRITASTAWRRLPMMSHTLKSDTRAPAMKAAVDKAKQVEEREDIHAVTVMAGFATSDIPHPCMSVIVVGKDQATAQQAADTLAQDIWESREGFVYASEKLADSIARAKALSTGQSSAQSSVCGNPNGPVLLLDHGDNCMSGGTCDTMDVLQEALAQQLSDIAVGPICDPEAVDTLFKAGEQAEVTLAVGNKRDLSHLGIHKTPPVFTGAVQCLSDGEYVISGPIYHGMKCSMGRTALLAVDGAEIVITEKPQEHWDLGVFSCVGLEVENKRYILLKSRMYCRPVFLPLAKAFVECDSGGVTSSNYSLFPFKKIKHPVFPLDRETVFFQT